MTEMDRVAGVSQTANLPGTDAIPLACASVSYIARATRVRAIVIKGLVAEEHRLRPPRASADVDLLVDPAGFDDLVAALRLRGWHERAHLWLFDRLEEHSMTLIHDRWPIDIDVHRHFPGFLLPPQQVFEELWSHRQQFIIAAQPVDGTDATAAAAVVALHALRRMHSERNSVEFEFLAEYLRSDSATTAELVHLATRTGSSETLTPLFQRLDVEGVPGPHLPAGALAAWNRRAAHPSRTGEWFSYFLRTPRRAWPRELAQVLWPARELFRQDHPGVPDATGALFVARIARLRNGAGGLIRIAVSDLSRLLAGVRRRR
ncbi:hypothetical protein [Herbiconiux sp. VKM Ac-2851]|uniref:hypothetical protein n=1 Tax=Herbiconiux sp. VKM Ac-2851 TaxID=2739025 RepID=UPI001565C9EA|nr:hypothetical protein [Herbiconiux sp. VKM Ac-2851]NQX35578.1 hypothetical protein [Herbiconiux sp. VKM Ac-2851]